MKNNLENAFRNSLQDYEVPYDPKAWEAVSSKLGAQAVTGTLMSSVLKWGLAAVILGAVTTGSYFLWFNNDEVKISEMINASNRDGSTELSAEKEVSTDPENKSDGNIIAPIEIEQSEKQESDKNKNVVLDSKTKGNTAQHSTQSTKEEVKTHSEYVAGQVPNTPDENKVVAEKFVAGHVSTSTACEGESIVISNQDKKGKVKFQLNGGWIVVQPGKSFVLKPTSSMEIAFVNEKEEVIETAYFKIQSLPSANFNFEANIFEEGLPVTICEAYGDYASYEWSFDDELKRNGPEVRHHFFEKGDYEIILKVVDRNGCKSTTTKTVRIRDKYNLMAVDAFKPNGSDSRNRTFMPYSLTERDVKFQLTIVDPIDNNIVFSSSDANNAWDGTDQKTGKMTPSNKAYMWKVQIFNPLPSERPIYAGTIVHN